MIISKAKKYKNFKEIRKFFNKESWVSLGSLGNFKALGPENL